MDLTRFRRSKGGFGAAFEAPAKAAFAAEIASLLRQLLSHQLMQQIDRLERAHHHLEMRDPAIVPAGDDIDAVELDPVDLGFELEDRTIVVPPFADKGEARAAQHLSHTPQILERDVAPALRRMHDG